MTQEEVIQGSILIAEFLGWEKDDYLKNHYRVTPEWKQLWFINIDFYRPSEMLFHRDYNWLMGVLFEIEKRGCIIETWVSLACGCRIMKPTNTPVVIAVQEDNSPYVALFRTIIEYINWYNTTKQQ